MLSQRVTGRQQTTEEPLPSVRQSGYELVSTHPASPHHLGDNKNIQHLNHTISLVTFRPLDCQLLIGTPVACSWEIYCLLKEADVNQQQHDQFIFHHAAIGLYIIKIQLDNELMTACMLTIFWFYTGGASKTFCTCSTNQNIKDNSQQLAKMYISQALF